VGAVPALTQQLQPLVGVVIGAFGLVELKPKVLLVNPSPLTTTLLTTPLPNGNGGGPPIESIVIAPPAFLPYSSLFRL